MSAARRAALVWLLGALLLGGCGGSSTVKPATYAKSVCTDLGNWKTTIQSAGIALQASDPAGAPRAAAKGDYQRFVSALAVATRRATSGLRDAGIPDETSGKRKATQLIRAFETASRQLTQAANQATAIRTDSISTFQLTATAVTNQIKSALETIRGGVLAGPHCRALIS